MAKPKKRKLKSKRSSPFKHLPFVTDYADGRCFWDVKPSGDYSEDVKRGVNIAQIYLSAIEHKNATPPLQWIVEHMPRELDGCMVGFLSNLHSRLIFNTYTKTYAECGSLTPPPGQNYTGNVIAFERKA